MDYCYVFMLIFCKSDYSFNWYFKIFLSIFDPTVQYVDVVFTQDSQPTSCMH